MTKYYHRTNLNTNTTPSSSEITEGEIAINASTLGSASNGFNNGRLYIKLSNGEIRRFIGLGLPGSSEESLKTKYGGTNNSFTGATAPSVGNSKPLMYFNYNSNGNHTIDKATNDTLTWNPSTGRLNVNKSTEALATLDVGGDVRIQTVDDWTTGFVSSFKIMGWSSLDQNVYGVTSTSFMGNLTDNTLPPSKISGVVGVTKGGIGVDLSSLTTNEGNIFFYNSSATRFDVANSLKWDNSYSILKISGSIENQCPTDSTTNAIPLGLNSSNRIVRLTSDNTNNIAFANIAVSGTTITADSNTDTLNIQAGEGISIDANTSTDTITITNTVIPASIRVTTITLTDDISLGLASDKYQFLNPGGSSRDVLLSLTVSEGAEFIIRNTDTTYSLDVYNGPTNLSPLLVTLDATYSAASFIHDGSNWRLALKSP